ncbi:hypothetical protein FB45DRAFT_83128 [Roridomyces roridus]|uniref:Uncharacterized protein n=1 Tax=Roridomyces roridus TaxID=1738132 RepID=A0AAD7BL21_9AGAR|nr:hypothetical protein FB45DRAFT_83128 [Roridomyces roridus]
MSIVFLSFNTEPPQFVSGVHYRADKIIEVGVEMAMHPPAGVSSSLASVSAPVPMPTAAPSSISRPLPVRSPSLLPTNLDPAPNSHTSHPPPPQPQPQVTRPRRQASTKKPKYDEDDRDYDEFDRPQRRGRDVVCDILAAAAASSSSQKLQSHSHARSKAKTRKWQEKPFGVLLPIILCQEYAYAYELPPEIWGQVGVGGVGG